MPDLWSHIIAGDMVVNELKDRALCRVILDNRKHFNMGSQGPDFFFYADFWPWIKKKKGPYMGRVIHEEKQAEFVISAFDILREKEGTLHYPQALAYFIGFVTHLVLDKKAHKIINAVTNDDKEHKRFEMELDCLLVEKYYNTKSYKLNPTSYIKAGEKLDSLIIDIYYLNITKLYDKNIELSIVNKSYQDMLKSLRILYSPFKIKAALLGLINNFFSLNLNQYIYANINSYKIISRKEIEQIEGLFPRYISDSMELIDGLSLYLKHEKDRNEVKKKIQSIIV
ncbi:MAG: zinc dependent phospholipase C family protein [Halanaerobiales bacterium]|nr:zinc dependent phospholipase C family protein [Halanaerobiales bacterium]